MTDTTALKPCPTCGETNAAFLCSDGYHYGWYASWNTRADTRPADSGLAGEFEKRVSAWRDIPFDTIDRGRVETAAKVLANFCEENLPAILSALTPATTDYDALLGELQVWATVMREADRPGMEGAARAFDEAAAAIRHLSADNARLREALEGSISRLGIIRITAELEDELDDRISLVQRSMLKALQENDRG